MDQLRDALKKVTGLPEGPAAPVPAAPVAPPLPDPMASVWVARLRALGADVPRDATWGQLTQRSQKLVKELKTAGRGRESAELAKLADDFARDRDTRAWALVKARFAELDLPERAYRALKQSDADPIRVWEKIRGVRGEALRGAGADRVREQLR